MKLKDNQLFGKEEKLVFQIGYFTSLYGLAVILFWLGIFKFTATEAAAIKPLIDSHPFLSWIYACMEVQTVSNIIGIIEILTALCISLSPFNRIFRLSASVGIIAIFLFTLSFIFTQDKSVRWIEGVPVVDFFILKDLVYLGFGGMVIAFSGIMGKLKK